MSNISNVRLPESIWETAQDKVELKQLILEYMKLYPGYKVLKVVGRMAVCDIGR